MSALVLLLLSQAPLAWDVPEVTSLVEVAGEPTAMGMPMKLHVATTKLDAVDAVAHYQRVFVQRGFFIPPAADQLVVQGAVQLTAFDPEQELSYMVVARPLAGGRGSKLLLSVASVQARPQPKDVPVFPGAEHVLTTSGEGSRTATYQVAAQAAEVEAFYSDVLRRSGFGKQPDGSFASKEEVARVSVKQAGGGRVTVTLRLSSMPGR